MSSVGLLMSTKLTSSIFAEAQTKNNSHIRSQRIVRESTYESEDASNFFTFMTIMIVISYSGLSALSVPLHALYEYVINIHNAHKLIKDLLEKCDWRR